VGLFLCEPPDPVGWVTRGEDCDDDDADVRPGEAEICNDVDDNCNGEADEGVGSSWYIDRDGDGFGVGAPRIACDSPTGHVADNTDCDDTRADVFPGAVEVCDALDNDCVGGADDGLVVPTWYPDADGDGARDAGGPTQSVCEAPFGYLADTAPEDCDDGNPSVFPAAAEVCNGLDDNCDTAVDQGVSCGATAFRVVISGQTYQYFDEELTWWEAAGRCASIGYSMVQIQGSLEEDSVMAWAQTLLSFDTGPGPGQFDGARYWLGYGFEACPNTTDWQMINGDQCIELATRSASERGYAESQFLLLSTAPDPADVVYTELSAADFAGSLPPEWLTSPDADGAALHFVCEAP
jgi:hypothetical protein